MNDNVIVLGNCHTNTLGLIRSLGEDGFKPILVEIDSEQHDYISKSKYLAKVYHVESPEKGLDLIMNSLKSTKGKTVIFPTSDEAAMAIDSHYNELSPDFHVASIAGSQGKVREFMNKETIRRFARDLGFNVPRSWVIDCSEGINLPDDIVYPCVIKAISSVAGRKDFDVYKTEDELRKGIENLAEESPSIQIQQYIEKDFEILLNGCVLKNGDAIIPCVLRKFRHYPSEFGGLAYGKASPKIEEYLNPSIITNLLQKLEYYGLFSVEFIVANGKAYFLEVNLRNDGTSYICTYGDVNLPAIWARDALGLENKYNLRVKKDYFTSFAIRDLHHVVAKRISFFRWLKDSCRSKVDLLWNWHDSRPAFQYFHLLLKNRGL